MKTDQRTKDFIARTLARGKTKTEAIRLLKRHVTRSLWKALQQDLNNLATALDKP